MTERMDSRRQDSYVFRILAKAFKAMLSARHEDTGDREEEMAEIIGVAKSYLNNLANGHAPIPADILVTAVREFGDVRPMQEMNRLCGLLAIPFPEGDALGERDARALVDRFHATAEAFFSARDPNGPGGSQTTRGEAAGIEEAGRGLQLVVEQIIRAAWDEAKSPQDGRCKTLAETAGREDVSGVVA